MLVYILFIPWSIGVVVVVVLCCSRPKNDLPFFNSFFNIILNTFNFIFSLYFVHNLLKQLASRTDQFAVHCWLHTHFLRGISISLQLAFWFGLEYFIRTFFYLPPALLSHSLALSLLVFT